MTGALTAADPLAALAYAAGGPVGRGRLRAEPEDFQVLELPGFVPSGDGEHLFLRIRKRGLTTEQAVGLVAQALAVKRNAISYAGMKDKWALTEQWLSVHLPGSTQTLPVGELAEGLWILESTHNGRKLRRGALAGNRFRLRLRDVEANPWVLSHRLAWIGRHGVPNYFGEQRFGRDGDNVELARAFFAGSYRPRNRNLQGILLSAARSYIFNQVLSTRLQAGTWNQPLAGDLMILDGRGSIFAAEGDLELLRRRAALLEIHPTGPLPGEGGSQPQGESAELERELLAAEAELVEGLQRQRVEAARRALRLRVQDLWWRQPQPDVLELGFALPAGAYATTVLREVLAT